MAIDFGALRPVNVLGAFQSGMENGREMKRQRIEQSALAAYAQNPDDPNAFAALLPVNPRVAMSIREDQTKRAETARSREALAGLAGQGGAGGEYARLVSAGIPHEIAAKMSADHVRQFDDGMKSIGNAAFRISTLPPQERAAAWDAAVAELTGTYPALAQYKGKYSEEALNSVLDQSGMTRNVYEARQPRIVPGPNGSFYEAQPTPWSGSSTPSGTVPATPAPAGGDLEAQAAAAIAAGADPAAVRARMRQLQGGAPSQGGATFP